MLRSATTSTHRKYDICCAHVSIPTALNLSLLALQATAAAGQAGSLSASLAVRLGPSTTPTPTTPALSPMTAPASAVTQAPCQSASAPSLQGCTPTAVVSPTPYTTPAHTPVTPQDTQSTLPEGSLPLRASPHTPVHQSQQQLQHDSAAHDGNPSEGESGRPENPAPSGRSSRSMSVSALLPPGSPFADALSVPSPTPHAAPQPQPSASDPREIRVTIAREGCAPISAPGPLTSSLGEAIGLWAQYSGLSADALQVCHKGCVLDRELWDLSFLKLGFAPPEVQLDVKVAAATAATCTTTAQDPFDSSQEGLTGFNPTVHPALQSPVAATVTPASIPSPAPGPQGESCLNATIHCFAKSTAVVSLLSRYYSRPQQCVSHCFSKPLSCLPHATGQHEAGTCLALVCMRGYAGGCGQAMQSCLATLC